MSWAAEQVAFSYTYECPKSILANAESAPAAFHHSSSRRCTLEACTRKNFNFHFSSFHTVEFFFLFCNFFGHALPPNLTLPIITSLAYIFTSFFVAFSFCRKSPHCEYLDSGRNDSQLLHFLIFAPRFFCPPPPLPLPSTPPFVAVSVHEILVASCSFCRQLLHIMHSSLPNPPCPSFLFFLLVPHLVSWQWRVSRI